MSDTAIRVENLGKLYRIGGNGQRHDTLRDAVSAAVRGLSSIVHRPGRADHRPQAARGDDASSIVRRPSSRPKDAVFWALRDVSFEVKRGEVIGVIGRNGAGKSTLLKILSRITEPTTGRAEIHGRVGSLLEVGTGFHPELTGRENIYLNGAILGMKRVEIARRFDEIVAFAEIDRFLDTPVKRYSSGMYVRLAFAVAAHLEPEILLVDEVLAVGDAAFQKKCLGKMSDVAGEGRTVLFVSHNMAAVENLCSRAAVLHEGYLVADDGAQQAIHAYLRGLAGRAEDTGNSTAVSDMAKFAVGGALITSVSFKLEDGSPSTVFPMGSPMLMDLELRGVSCQPDTECVAIFFTAQGQRVFTTNSRMTCVYESRERSPRELACLQIDRLPLTPGIYWVDLGIYQYHEGYLEYFERAASFEVVEADVYGSGYRVPGEFGIVYVDGRWTIRNHATEI